MADRYDTMKELERELTEAALLGVARSNWVPEHLPDTLRTMTQDAEEDRAGTLLNALTLLRHYRAGGERPAASPPPPMPPPLPAEQVGPEEAVRLWRQIQAVETAFPALELRWLELLRSSGWVAAPELVPELLEAGKPVKMDALKPLIATVTGARGQWLAQLNPAWQYILPKDDELIWREGSIGARVAALRRVRTQQPARAREWLSLSWGKEAATDRRRLAEVLLLHIGPEDEVFLLEAVQGTFRQKNQAAAELRGVLLQLLLSIPESKWKTDWQELIRNHQSNEKTAPSSLLPAVKTAWELLDSFGKIAYTPPSLILKAIDKPTDQAVEQFLQQGHLKALEAATVRYRDEQMARLLLRSGDISDPYSLFSILPPPEREQMMMTHSMLSDWVQAGKYLHFHWTLSFSQWVLQQLYDSWSGYHFSRVQGILPLWVFLNKDARPEDIPSGGYTAPVQREKWSQMIVPELNKLLFLKRQLWRYSHREVVL